MGTRGVAGVLAVTERHVDGHLVPDVGVRLTTDIFATADAAHLAAARAVHAALAPFNAVPWTPETGK